MIERLGWTLVQFLWQGTLIAFLYAAARRLKGLPHMRYLLACAALTAMVAAPLVTFGLLTAPELTQSSAPLAASVARVAGAGAAVLRSASWTAAVPERENVLTWIVLLWMAGASALWVRLMGGWLVAARMRSQRVRPAPPEWQRILDQIGGRIGLTRPVRLLVSALVEVPTVIGWLRPVVLVPVAALAGLPPEHVEALLAHELAHIRRHDYLVNILQSIAEALLFYHPAVWWVSGHIRAERELCCDDIAVSVSGDVLTYAHALTELESNRPAHLDPALAANGASLTDRIARLLGQSHTVSRTLPGPGVLASAILLIITAFGVFGQSTARPRFEVSSIKLNNGDWFGSEAMRPLPGGGLMVEHVPLGIFIQTAYDLKPFQIVGGPEWTMSDRYDFEAKLAGKTNWDQTRLMMQSLLEDWFQMKVHREMRQFPVLALTVAKSGLKLQQPGEEPCFVFDRYHFTPPPPPRPGQPLPLVCGGVMFSRSSARLLGAKASTAALSRTLTDILGRTVVDQTGFTGTFDVYLQLVDATDQSIFAAVEEQLGLRLESTIAPIEVLVIDHVERPTEN